MTQKRLKHSIRNQLNMLKLTSMKSEVRNIQGI
jgi:hypothetical protein